MKDRVESLKRARHFTAGPLFGEPSHHPPPLAIARCPPPAPCGGLLITSSPTIQHIYCVSAPPDRLFAFSLATIRPMPRYRFGMGRAHAQEKVIRLRTKKIHKKVHQNVLKLFTITL